MKSEEARSEQSKKVMEKGNCPDCAHYNDCPRMKGINHCYNMHVVRSGDPDKERPLPEKNLKS